eukprot:4825425-Pleurochrysis_carterae.AAC.1
MSWGDATSVPLGRPATPVDEAGCGGTADVETEDVVLRHEKVVSSKYTSDVTTTRKPGTSTRNAF